MRMGEIRSIGRRHFRPTASGECTLTNVGEAHPARWELGTRYTDRAAVSQGYYARIALNDATDEFLGFCDHSLRRALLGAADAAQMAGFDIDVAGAHADFIKRGIGWNTGWGEVKGQLTHMMQRS